MEFRFERLVSRNISYKLSHLLDLAGLKMTVNKLLSYMVIGSIVLMVTVPFVLYFMKINIVLAILSVVIAPAVYLVVIYFILNYLIDKRKSIMENYLPDYLQITAANLRSGVSLDRAMLMAARPEFGQLSLDVKEMNKKIYGGETLDAALTELANSYDSTTLKHSVRMVLEAYRYGGAMSDLISQMSKDLKNQQLTMKEISGQLLMYSIFIVFAGLIAAPAMYGLTSQMIVVTDTVWKGILAANPGGLPTTGVSFLKPSPPKISPQTYHTFSLISIIFITGFAAIIMSTIQSGSAIKGIKFVPVFIIVGIILYYIVGTVISGIFTGLGA